MISRQTSLSGNIVQFCRFLRQQDFAVSADEEINALQSLKYIDYTAEQIFRLALKAVLCRSKSQLEQFDKLFSDYWLEIGQAVDAKVKSKTTPDIKSGANEAAFKTLKAWLNGNSHPETEPTASYSIHQNLAGQDFAKVPPEDLDEMMRIIKFISRRLAAQASRRFEKNAKINRPDLHQTLRRNMRNGGELIELAFQKPKRNRQKLVVLCDISKSMELYTAFLLNFIYAFGQVYRRIETFAFSTALHRITPLLKHLDFTKALQALSAPYYYLGGGTKIGESLQTFVAAYATRFVDKHTIIIILSDGWDTSDIRLLSQSMEVMHKRSQKMIWLNPLAGYTGYRPEVAGMQAALPYIDVLAPVHNLASLKKLSKWL